MELLKKNIHMDRTRTQAVTQFALEDDMNIPDNKPDVRDLNLEKGDVVVEEIRPATDSVTVRGKLNFAVLYYTMEEGSSLVRLEGKLPFEEKVNLQGVTSMDNVTVDSMVEDISVSMINSRKLGIQALITMNAAVEELYDEEIPTEISGEEQVEYRRMPITPAQLSICKNDIFRLKEEVGLPANYPNIFQILWEDISLGDVEFKVVEGKLLLSGDIHLFVLYEGEGEEHPCRSFETVIPFSGALECYGCRDGMLPDIRYKLGQQEVSVRPDFDGEERNIGLEMVIEIAIRVYEEEHMEMLADIYGVSKEVSTQSHKVNLRSILTKMTGKTKVSERIEVGEQPILQLLHSRGCVVSEQQSVVENGILLQGSVRVKVMYITGVDESPYGCTQVHVPYRYMLEIPDIAPEDIGEVHAEVEQLQVTMSDGDEMDVKVVLAFSTVVFKVTPMEILNRVEISDLDSSKLSGLPGMVVYVVKSGDNLWNIGRKYYVPVDTLREINNLESDELKVGQKLLIVK